MIRMRRFWGSHGLLIWPATLALLSTVGCLGPAAAPTEEGTTQANQAPFHDGATAHDSPGLPASASAQNTSTTPGNSLPFHDSQNLPSGTLLTVQLKDSLSAAKPAAHDSFEATMDEPVVIDGNTLIPRGAAVVGRVESFSISTVRPNHGYIRLKLESVHVAGLDLPVQTASLFVRPAPRKGASSPTIRLDKGHRLTFRLAEPLYLATQRAQISH